jgi:hypothetical protein
MNVVVERMNDGVLQAALEAEVMITAITTLGVAPESVSFSSDGEMGTTVTAVLQEDADASVDEGLVTGGPDAYACSFCCCWDRML